MSGNGNLNIGDTIEGEVFKVTDYGAFVKLGNGQKGLIHISQIAETFVKSVDEHLKVGDRVSAKVVNVADGKIDLTLKKAQQEQPREIKSFRFNDFEDKLKKFLKDS